MEAGRRKSRFPLRDEGQMGRREVEKQKFKSHRQKGKAGTRLVPQRAQRGGGTSAVTGRNSLRVRGSKRDGQLLNQRVHLTGADVASHWWSLGATSNQ